MESHINPAFRKCFAALSAEVQRAAIADYRLWKRDPFANGLHFKSVDTKKIVWSIRAGIGWRAFGTRKGDEIVWYWIGSHEEYNRLIKNVRKKDTTNIQDKALNRG